ncbi:hypothetical protein [Pseudonocardia parietis]|uniref:3-methyl-2-oxobutanoate hydroxymethyltransferase n=1 Tax=Pseudonocardia parietis TaxID=570936 RepID=A0ABS4VSD2_9PSEU|nr:hypothetical protein [Pseudonocardia parietis]MBP2366845.1 hypothetical protein [Pseudonocardia parietis]
MGTRPILPSSCALATTAEEAGYRIDAPVEGRRGTRVVALDDDAATAVRRLARERWNAARFLTLRTGPPPAPDGTDGTDGTDDALPLHHTGGAATDLAAELAAADAVVMIASARAGDAAALAAGRIGRACAGRGVMTAGIVLGGADARASVAALRPHARVLLAGADDRDAADLLTAIRA